MFKQIPLRYSFDALEPYIDKKTMLIHYTRHHAAYTEALNAAVEGAPELQGRSIESLLRGLNDIDDPKLRTAIRNNGGGFYNHNLYFGTLSPDGGGEPGGTLRAQIEKDFGSVQAMKQQLTNAATGQFGSGWAWLSADKEGNLTISTSPNQDNPLIEGSAFVPILGIDVWEHAYYLQYQNRRADYVRAFWEVVDWDAVQKLYDAVQAQP